MSPSSIATMSKSQPLISARRLSARMYARRLASDRCSTNTHGTSVMPSACAASTRPCPAMIFPAASISTGLIKPNSRMLALSCAICASLCVLVFRAYGTSSEMGRRSSCSGINHVGSAACSRSPGPAVPSVFCFAICFSPSIGKKSCAEGGLRSCAPCPETFFGWGDAREIHGFPARVRAPCVRAAPVRASSRSAPFAARLCPAFGSGFAAVTRVAQALQVVWVGELLPVALERDDVVNVGRPLPDADPGALTAKRLIKQLRRPQIVRPNRQAVPTPPRPALCAAPLHALWLVLLAVAASHQRRAAWMQAGAQGLTCHDDRPA